MFYVIEGGNTFYGLFGHGRGLDLGDIVELAAHMRPTSGFKDLIAIELFIAGIGVGVQNAVKSDQVILWMFTLTIGAVIIGNGGRGCITIRLAIADIDPKPAGLGSSLAGLKDWHRRVIAMEPIAS